MAILHWFSELLRYSILSTEWWQNILQGSVGSFVALVGVLLLIRHERTRDRNARAAEQRKEDAEERRQMDQRAYESLMGVNTLCSDLMLGSKKEERPAHRLADELFHFSIREVPHCPKLHRWLQKHQHYLILSMKQEKEPQIVGAAAGYISGALSSWMIDGRPEDFFDSKRFDPDKQWQEIFKDKEIKPFPSLDDYDRGRK